MVIDTKTVEQARNTDLIDFLGKRCGYTFKQKGGSLRCEQHPSLAVKNDRQSFFWFSKSIGGFGVLDYLIKIENMKFREAVEVVSGMITTPTTLRVNLTRKETEPPKTLILPEKSGFPMRLYDYLCKKRGIDDRIVHLLIQKGNLYEDRRGNVVFIGFDEHGKAKFACVRGTHGNFRGDCSGSDKRYAFYLESPYSNQLYVFESPVDALSRASMENIFRNDKEAWKRKNYLSLAGTSDTAIPLFLNKRPDIKEIVFCLDNDPAGQEAAAVMSKKYADKDFYVRIEPPLGKDYNTDLIKMLEIIQLEKSQKNIVKTHKEMTI